jgi:hypothetical protein
MTLAYPLSGRDVGGASGRAAWQVDSGAGFHWSSMIGRTVGYPNRGMGAIDWGEILKTGIDTGRQVLDWQLNPLLRKDVYQQDPRGVYAGNVPGGPMQSLLPGGTGAGLGSMLPILLIGGLVILLVARR